MQSIYEAATVNEFIARIETLKPDTQRKWGTMDVSQMLAHCAIPLEIAMGEKEGKKTLMGMLIGRFAKSVVTNEKPFKQGLPTNPDFVVKDKKDFNQEKHRLIGALDRISKMGANKMNNREHTFFGRLTAEEWSNSTVKHTDHHLRQFGA